MADSAGRRLYSRNQLFKFALYAGFSPVFFTLLFFNWRRPSRWVHFLWADKIYSKDINAARIIRFPSCRSMVISKRSWIISVIVAILRFAYVFKIKGNASKLEYLAFVVEMFVVDCVALSGYVERISTASALERKSLYISRVCKLLEIKHSVFQHGVINRFNGVVIPECDEFICCFPWSVSAVEWIYRARNIMVLPAEAWYFPGWDAALSADVLWATSPVSAEECETLIKFVQEVYGVQRVSVKLHPRDSNINIYCAHGFSILTVKPANLNLVIGQISTVLAEAFVRGIPYKVIQSTKLPRQSCLDFLHEDRVRA